MISPSFKATTITKKNGTVYCVLHDYTMLASFIWKKGLLVFHGCNASFNRPGHGGQRPAHDATTRRAWPVALAQARIDPALAIAFDCLNVYVAGTAFFYLH